MACRLDISIVRDAFVENKLLLISETYKNAYGELMYVDIDGKTKIITWRNFKIKYGYDTGNHNKNRFDIEQVREVYSNKGCTLITNEYRSANQKLDYICPNGHFHSMKFSHFKDNHKCPYCVGVSSPDIEFIREDMIKYDYRLLSSEYINNRSPLVYECPRGHIRVTNWSNWNSHGKRCKICFHEDNVGPNHGSWRGGISYDEYCDAWADKEYKLDLKERDGFRCQNPYCSCNGGVLCLHHIDYNKRNCHPSNLIILCRVCHGYSNVNRDWHTEYFQTLMSNKYNYIYTQV